MTNILITGSKGFIGVNLEKYLKNCGYNVTGVDFQDGDLRENGEAEYLILKHKPEIVIHLAAQVGIYFNEQDCVHAINSNAIMTLRVAKACAKYGARLIHTSTSEVYGDHGEKVVNEDAPLIGKATGIYSISKRWSEEAAREYAPEGLVIIRPSMPYGTGVPPGKGRRAMDNMLWQAHHRKPIIVHRGSVRSWCWIDDLCKGYELIIKTGVTGAFNIGRDDDERTMRSIAEMACDLAGAPRSLICEVDPPVKKVMIKRLATDKLRSLGWTPTVEVEEGMPILYDWIKTFPWVDEIQ
jgi:nucleoside-diphosphate-sugar epimerase